MSNENSVPALKARLLDLLLTQAALGGRLRALPADALGASARAVPEGRWTQ